MIPALRLGGPKSALRIDEDELTAWLYEQPFDQPWQAVTPRVAAPLRRAPEDDYERVFAEFGSVRSATDRRSKCSTRATGACSRNTAC
jgi:hypothetical protein